MNETQPRPMYDVIVRFVGEPADTGEKQNEEPLPLIEACALSTERLVDLRYECGYVWDGKVLNCPAGVRFRQQMHHARNIERLIYIDVTESEAES